MRQTGSKAGGEGDGRAALSVETQRRVIQAAIEVFGQHGFEGASTRALMTRAGANLAAIPYHFGGKRGLYLAAAQAIADYGRERIEPILNRLLDRRRGNQITRIDDALSDFIQLLVGGTEPKAWVSFFVRCEHDADDAFRTIYEAIVPPFKAALAETVAEVIGCDPADEGLLIKIAIVLTSIINLRTLQNMLLRVLGWNELNPNRLEHLSAEIRRFALSELVPQTTGAKAST